VAYPAWLKNWWVAWIAWTTNTRGVVNLHERAVSQEKGGGTYKVALLGTVTGRVSRGKSKESLELGRELLGLVPAIG